MEALFTSLVGGNALRQRILQLIEDASTLAASHAIDLHIMTFAFTDEEIAHALQDAAMRCPSLDIRILADWSQRIRDRGQQVGRLASLHLRNLQVRYNYDQPYIWDAPTRHMRWSYRASRGLLHHKTLGILVNGRPWRLMCGSFNWTAAAARGYENLLILTSDHEESRPIMARMELEFEALWSDGRISLSVQEAHLHYQAILEQYARNPAISPAEISGLKRGAGERLQKLDPKCWPPQDECQSTSAHALATSDETKAAIAFGWRGFEKGHGQGGNAERNRSQRLILRSPLGKLRFVPLTITTLALATIFRSARGDTLKVAMYGMSARVPEYGALLDAARRGVRVLLLLDQLAGAHVSSRLQAAQENEGLAIEVRTAGRTMHQKYLIHAETATVVTGTANMSTDATSRHSEHRIQIGGCRKLAEQFNADFDTIWGRLSAHSASGQRKEERSEPLSSNSEAS
jgi:hypothetical protein